MILLSGLAIAFVCIVAVSFIIAEYSKINGKSSIPYTDTAYLQDRQSLMEALDAPSASTKEKPKSNLRGVQNKRFKKK